jgi:hypothetical protein
MGSIDPPNSSYPPFPDAGTLKGLNVKPLTPIIGTEIRDVDITEWLRAPNSDDILRDVALLSMSLKIQIILPLSLRNII